MLRWLHVEGKKNKSGKGATLPKKCAGLLWVYAVAPTEAEQAEIIKRFRIPARYLKNFKHENRSTRHSLKPFYCTFVDYTLDQGKIKRSNVFYALEENCLVTVLESPIALYDELFEKGRTTAAFEKFTPAALMTEILDADINENYEVLELSENQITEMQKRVTIAEQASESIARIIELRRTLNRMSRAFWGSSRISYTLRRGLTDLSLSDDEKKRIDDLHDALMHQVDIVSSQKEMLTDAITIYQTTISNRLATISNKINTSIQRLTWIMLLMTGLTLILTVPNTVATMFGIPEFPLYNDWPVIVVILLTATVLPLLWFVFYWRSIRHEANIVNSLKK